MNIVWLPCYRNLWSHIHVQVLTQNCRFIFTEYWVLWTISKIFDTHWFCRSLIHFQFPFALINVNLPFSIYDWYCQECQHQLFRACEYRKLIRFLYKLWYRYLKWCRLALLRKIQAVGLWNFHIPCKNCKRLI